MLKGNYMRRFILFLIAIGFLAAACVPPDTGFNPIPSERLPYGDYRVQAPAGIQVCAVDVISPGQYGRITVTMNRITDIRLAAPITGVAVYGSCSLAFSSGGSEVLINAAGYLNPVAVAEVIRRADSAANGYTYYDVG